MTGNLAGRVQRCSKAQGNGSHRSVAAARRTVLQHAPAAMKNKGRGGDPD